jgi:copper oxidase (laccase) domain-containing protein
MSSNGHAPEKAFLGPGIGSCCYEVGDDVSKEFPEHRTTTSWGSDAVDLAGAVRAQLSGLDVWTSGRCTHHDEGLFSHRRNGTDDRLAAVGWIP